MINLEQQSRTQTPKTFLPFEVQFSDEMDSEHDDEYDDHEDDQDQIVPLDLELTHMDMPEESDEDSEDRLMGGLTEGLEVTDPEDSEGLMEGRDDADY